MRPLAQQLIELMPELTARRSLDKALANVRYNTPFVRRTIAELAREAAAQERRSAIVLAAGPSLHRTRAIAQIKASGYDGDLVAVDSALGPCLREGLVPDYVVTLDPLSVRICRWFGDPDLDSREDDDYFRRQEMDPYLGRDEAQRNRELVELVNRHGSAIKAAICTSSTPEVTRRCAESGMTLYWWNPLVDDVDRPDSVTRQLYQMNRAPCMASGGNVGAAAWVVASHVLRRREVAVVGMDFGYPPGTPVEKTQYYPELRELFGDRLQEAIIPVENPHLGETWFADPAYYWYRTVFLQMASEADCVTYNCTGGGTLVGPSVRWTPLQEFLAARCPAGKGP